jgi:hypothetical protein
MHSIRVLVSLVLLFADGSVIGQALPGDLLIANQSGAPYNSSILALTPDSGDIVVAGGNNVPAILHYDPTGRLLGTLLGGTLGSPFNVCMAVEDEHNLWGTNAPTVGGVLGLSIRFAAHPGKPYLAAASLLPRPGIRVDQRTIPLYPNALFRLSVAAPWMFVHFQGMLDPGGRASTSPHVLVPRSAALRGVRVYFAAVVVDPKAPSGIAAISRPYGVTLQ